MLNREQILKSFNNLSKEVKFGMKKDEKKFNELQNMKPKVHLEVRKFNHHEK